MSNSVVVVTGGSGGIGQALIKKYLQEGCFVISADLEKTTDFDEKNFSFLQCNVECENSINRLFEFVLNKYSRIDYFFSNAISRASKTMSECRQIKYSTKKTGTDNL